MGMNPARTRAEVVVALLMLTTSAVAPAGDEMHRLAYRFGPDGNLRYRLGYSQQAHFSFTDIELPGGDQQISFEGVLEFRAGPQAGSAELLLSDVKARQAEDGRSWTAPKVEFDGIGVPLEFGPTTGFSVAEAKECSAGKADEPLEKFAGAVGRLLPLLFPRFGPEKVERTRQWESEVRLRPLGYGSAKAGMELVLREKYRFLGMARCGAGRCAKIEAEISLGGKGSGSKSLSAELDGTGRGQYLF
ncbi:MAG: hypothetical protein D6806_15905, partial [Deltaproteobacteria bacterium]